MAEVDKQNLPISTPCSMTSTSGRVTPTTHASLEMPDQLELHHLGPGVVSPPTTVKRAAQRDPFIHVHSCTLSLAR